MPSTAKYISFLSCILFLLKTQISLLLRINFQDTTECPCTSFLRFCLDNKILPNQDIKFFWSFINKELIRLVFNWNLKLFYPLARIHIVGSILMELWDSQQLASLQSWYLDPTQIKTRIFGSLYFIVLQ